MELTGPERTIIDDIEQDYGSKLPDLAEVFASLTVVKRENTGHGFFSYLRSAKRVPLDAFPSYLGCRIYKMSAAADPCGAVLLMADGQPHLIDFHVFAEIDTSGIDFAEVTLSPWPDDPRGDTP